MVKMRFLLKIWEWGNRREFGVWMELELELKVGSC